MHNEIGQVTSYNKLIACAISERDSRLSSYGTHSTKRFAFRRNNCLTTLLFVGFLYSLHMQGPQSVSRVHGANRYF